MNLETEFELSHRKMSDLKPHFRFFLQRERWHGGTRTILSETASYQLAPARCLSAWNAMTSRIFPFCVGLSLWPCDFVEKEEEASRKPIGKPLCVHATCIMSCTGRQCGDSADSRRRPAETVTIFIWPTVSIHHAPFSSFSSFQVRKKLLVGLNEPSLIPDQPAAGIREIRPHFFHSSLNFIRKRTAE